MSCQNHPNKESVANCLFCGKELCKECTITIASKHYCEECMNELIGPELSSITGKNKSNEAQETAPSSQTTAPSQVEAQETEQMKIIPQDDISEPTIEKELVGKDKEPDDVFEDTNQKIPSQDSQNIDNIDDAKYNDIYNDDRLYDDIHEDEAQSTQANSEIEEKYEKYLDDLYFDEENLKSGENGNVSLSEQLAQDEAEHGSLTKEPFIPNIPEKPIEEDRRNKNIPIMRNLRNVSSKAEDKAKDEEAEPEYTVSSLHRESIHYKKEGKKAYTSTEKILTIILIILIIFVVIYLIYLLTLHAQYSNFFDALTAFFTNPSDVLGEMIS